MKLIRRLCFLVAAMSIGAIPMFAADPANGGGGSGDLKLALVVIGMAIASGLCGLGQGKATASAAEGIARNPGAVAAIRGAMLIGLVLIESLALYTLVIAFIAINK